MEIGQRRGNRIYAGPDFGWQSIATFNKLKNEGAFRFGSQELRRIQSSLNERFPKSIKARVKQFLEHQAKVNEFAAEQRQKSYLGKAAQASIDIQGFKDKAIGKAVDVVSEKTNVARPLVAGTAFLLEGRVEAGSARLAIPKPPKPKGTVSTRQSRGSGKPNSIQQRLRKAKAVPKGEVGVIGYTDPDRLTPDQRKLQDEFKRKEEVSGLIRDKVRDIQSGKAKPHPDSVRKASDPESMARARASGAASRFPPDTKQNTAPVKYEAANPNDPFAEYPLEGVKSQGTRQGETGRILEIRPQQNSSRGRGFDGSVGVPADKGDWPVIPGGKGMPRVTRSRLQEVTQKIRERNKLRDKAQRKAVSDFFSGDGTASTFPSKKGKDVRGGKSAKSGGYDDDEGYMGAYDDLYSADDGSFGDQVIDAERRGRRGQPGQRIPLETNIKIKKLEEVTGMRLSGLSGAERKERIINYLRDTAGIDIRKLDQKSQDQYLFDFIQNNTLGEDASRARASRYVQERNQPEQFNQIEAQEQIERNTIRRRSDGHPQRDKAGKPLRVRTQSAGPRNPELPPPASQNQIAQRNDKAGRRTRNRTGDRVYIQLDKDGRELKVLSGKVEANRLRKQGIEVRERIASDRDYVLGRGYKSRQSQYGADATRTDNVQGGRRIPQSEVTETGQQTTRGRRPDTPGSAQSKPNSSQFQEGLYDVQLPLSSKGEPRAVSFRRSGPTKVRNTSKSKLKESLEEAKRLDNLDNLPKSSGKSTTRSSIKSRAETTAARKRAKNMVSFQGKRSYQQVIKYDKAGKRSGDNTKLPQAGNVTITKDGRVTVKPSKESEQFKGKTPKAPNESTYEYSSRPRNAPDGPDSVIVKKLKEVSRDDRKEIRNLESSSRAVDNLNNMPPRQFTNRLPEQGPEFDNNRMTGQNTNQEFDPRRFSTKNKTRLDGSTLPSEDIEQINILSEAIQGTSGKKRDLAKKELREFLKSRGLGAHLAEEYYRDFIKSQKRPAKGPSTVSTPLWRKDGQTVPTAPALPAGSGGVKAPKSSPRRTPEQRKAIRERLDDLRKLGKSGLSREATALIKASEEGSDSYRTYGRNKSRTTDDQGFSRDATKDDDIYNSNPFTPSGELRTTTTVSDTEFLGVNEVKMKGQDPAGKGRSKSSDRKSITEQLAELRATAAGENIKLKSNGEPTKTSLKQQRDAQKELEQMQKELQQARSSRASRSLQTRANERQARSRRNKSRRRSTFRDQVGSHRSDNESFVERMKRLRSQ